ncbi:MerR family transcriptional regulator [Niallia sp. 03133]|uniref:MerR family transcriptional regulator n=1 Tax=Niallia sp. 03133 TaxID=3458060 RepID=UPI0040451A33
MNEEKDMIQTKESNPLSVKEAAEYIKESPGVVRNWLRELKSHIPTIVGNHGYRYFDKEGLEMLLVVQKLRREQNLSLSQIEDELSSSKQPSIISHQDATERILQDLNTIKEQLELQVNFNQVLVQQLKKQQEHIIEQQQFIQQQKEHIAALNTGSYEKESVSSMPRKVVLDESNSKKQAFFRLFSYR